MDYFTMMFSSPALGTGLIALLITPFACVVLLGINLGITLNRR